VLIPRLRPDDIVVMDNLPAHKIAAMRAAIPRSRRSALPVAGLLARHEPDRDALAKLKALLRRRQNAPAMASGDAWACWSTNHPQ
jgi:hypothetical protein